MIDCQLLEMKWPRLPIGWLLVCLLNPVLSQPGYSQIVPDASLEGEQSQLVRNRRDQIDIGGGARRGANLFHSFREFNVGLEEIVQFRNPAGVDTIFTRVTGNNPSQILGGLGVRGGANLFLLNPNGILFGNQTTINLSGSFIATTASAVQFGSESFSAINPELPSALLSVHPSALLFQQIGMPAALDQQGQLTVDDGRTIALLGGAGLRLNGSQLTAPDGQIILAAIQSPGVLEITSPTAPDFALPAGIPRGDAFVEDNTTVDATGQGAGRITVYANNLTIADSRLQAGSRRPSRLSAPELGNIVLDVTAATTLSNATISHTVPISVPGNSGDIVIRTGSLFANRGTSLISSNFGFGQSGNIQIQAQGEVVFDGAQTQLRTATNRGLIAEAGNIEVSAQSVSLTRGARLTSSTFGQGDGGNITIVAPVRVLLAGSGNNRLGGGLYSTVEPSASGNSGTITIQTGELTVLDGASVTTRSLGQGSGGRIMITATGAVRLSGISEDAGPIPSGFFSSVEASASGAGGNLRIQAQSLRLENGAQIQANLAGTGRAGNVRIRVEDAVTIDGRAQNGARSAIFTNVEPNAEGTGGSIEIFADALQMTQAQLTSSTGGRGNAGPIRLRVATIDLNQGSSILTNVRSTAIGTGGTIDLETDSLRLRDGSQMITATAGRGDAGDILITARNQVVMTNRGNEPFVTSLISGVGSSGIGQGGDITIQTPQLLLDGSQIRAETMGRGDAGNIQVRGINAESHDGQAVRVLLTNQATMTALATREAIGQGGNITVQANQLELDRSRMTSQSQGRGDAGEIRVVVGEQFTATDSSIITAASQASGGRVRIDAPDGEIQLLGDSNIRTEVTGGAGGAGDITLTADSILAYDDSDILAFANQQGGRISLNTPVFFGESYQPSPVEIDPRTLDGNQQVDVNANAQLPGTISLPDTSFIQNSLADLSENAIDPDSLIANSCIARTEAGGTFLITGTGGLPTNRPDARTPSSYPTDTVRTEANTGWQPGDPIIEPQGVYQLPNGELILSHECR